MNANKQSQNNQSEKLETAKKRQNSRLIEESEKKSKDNFYTGDPVSDEQINAPREVKEHSDYREGDSDSEYPAPEENKSIYRERTGQDDDSDLPAEEVPTNDAGIYHEKDILDDDERDDLPENAKSEQEGDARLYREAEKEPGYDPDRHVSDEAKERAKEKKKRG